MAPSSKFWDKIAERYAKRPVGNEEAYQEKLRITQEYLNAEMEVLEFGCGTGTTALIHAPHVKHIRAIDISAKMLEIAQGKADAADVKNITFEKSTIEDLSAPEGSPEPYYDVVMGHSILHLLEDKEAAIAKVFKMLKPGGLFITSTVCLGDKMKFFKLIGPIGKFFGLMPLLKVFSVKELVESVTAAGFTIDRQWQPDGGMSVFIVAKLQGDGGD